jgi:hypothetical protein
MSKGIVTVQTSEVEGTSMLLIRFKILDPGIISDQIKEDVMARASGTHRGEKVFGWEMRRKEIAWKT